MKVAFILSGLPDGLQCLDRNRQKVAETLHKYGWITRVDTPFYSQASLLAIINEYKDKEIEDFIFFYTGHGDTSSEEGVLTLKLHDGTRVDINTLHRDYFSELNTLRKAVILDACYSGNFEGRKFHDGIEYLCSSDFDQESYEDISEDGLQHSYFSYHFCEALDNLEGEVTLDMINEKYLQPNVDVQNSKYVSIDSKMVIVNKDYYNILNQLPNNTEEEPSELNKIFLIFTQSDTSEVSYDVLGYIQYESEFENETIEFTFENIHNAKEQDSFIQLLVDEFDSDITIHCIIPPSLLLINFKQWEYKGNTLVNRYHILLHNKENFESKIRKYKSMIFTWEQLYSLSQKNQICEALLPVDDGKRFDTRLEKMGIYFQNQLNDDGKIINALDIAKVGLWQYKGGCPNAYTDWIDTNCLEQLECQSRKCNYVALVWDDMRLLEDLKKLA